jgi:hypothetical protein
VPKPNDSDATETRLSPEQAQLALEESIKRVNDVVNNLEEAQKTRDEIFELVVSV